MRPESLTPGPVVAGGPSRLARAAAGLVAASIARPRLVLLLSALVGAAAIWLVLTRFALDTNVVRLFPPNLSWRVAEQTLLDAFPDRRDRIVVVIDAASPDRANAAASTLATALRGRPALFRSVLDPEGDPLFARSALLYSSQAELSRTLERVIEAQPLLGTLAADPSLRGVAGALRLFTEGLTRDPAARAGMLPAVAALTSAATAAPAGHVAPVDWRALFTGTESGAARRILLLHPRPDFMALAPIQAAIAVVRAEADRLAMTPESGVRLRLTGELVLEDEEFNTVFGGAIVENLLSLLSVAALLWLGLRSGRLIFPLLFVLVLGLVLTTAFGLLFVGPFNLLSIAFAVLFIGLGVDFGIQYVVSLREARHARMTEPLPVALVAAAGDSGPGIALAAGALAAGFLAFWPTDYRGVSELGVIAAAGMGLAVLVSLTTLPAMLLFTRPRAEVSGVGYAMLAPLDRWLTRRARLAMLLALLATLVAGASLFWLRFDTDPLNLRDPSTEAVSTWRDLQRDPRANPDRLQVLAPDLAAAAAMATRLAALPEVGEVLTLADLVPRDQPAKLALIEDAAALLGPTLETPAWRSGVPDPIAGVAGLGDAAADLARAGLPEARRLEQALRGVAADVWAARRFEAAVLPGLTTLLDGLRLALTAAPVALTDLPESVRHDWIAADGRVRIEVAPSDPARLDAFIAAVQRVAPLASGPPISIAGSASTIGGAFLRAGLIAAVLIPAMLFAALRSVRLVALALAPLGLAALLTGATCVLIGLPLNLANIVALPLLFAQGVAFDIYYVTAWQAGERALLPSALTRAVLYSALTNGTAFGTLALSSHPGTASLGLLLTLSLLWAMVTVLLTLPPMLALFAPREPVPARS